MPKCKNVPTGHYKGTEPSPKGRGFCARAERVGTRKKGGDGKMWCVKSYQVKGKRVKRWVRCVPARKKKPKVRTDVKGGMMGALHAMHRGVRRVTGTLKPLPPTVHSQYVKFTKSLARKKRKLRRFQQNMTSEEIAKIRGEINGLQVVLGGFKRKYHAHKFPTVETVSL